ncbi:TPM domain-containing protein [Sphingobium sp. B12D2B]|uniref:TPM domain-containing protein n=1 Tax=Sphingobium sp. B12D2B TaxID=2940577 RepID=UPI002224ED3F|nr:TPM domain-containing protein [Sphingobium sp. B12D2B]MCW2350918.1 uncharacterized protein [Sphingobium sp. B12D2B]
MILTRGLSALGIAALCVAAGLMGAPAAAGEPTETAQIVLPSSLPIARDGWVTDAAALFTPDQRHQIERRLVALQAATGREAIVVTVPSLDGQDIARYASEVGDRWAVGAPGAEGIVILLAPREQLVRIAVGQGLAAAIPDDDCQAIIDTLMLPQFRNGLFEAGLVAGIAELEGRL